MKVSAMLSPVVVVVGLAGAYFAAPDSWHNAFMADVRAGDSKLSEEIIQVREVADNDRVCRLREENRRLDIDMQNTTNVRYKALLQAQFDANVEHLKRLAAKGALCAG